MALKVSVIVPIYNVEEYLETCLESICNQTYKDFEVVCVNDCTEDGSMDIVKRYSSNYRNFKVINNVKNSGLSFSRNAGLEVAEGKYVLFIDSDDYLLNDALERLVNSAEKRSVDIVYYNKKIILEDGSIDNKYKNVFFDELGVLNGREMFYRFMQNRTFKSINAYTQFFLREFLLKNKLCFLEGAVHEDYLFFFQCAMKAKRTCNINDELYVYRKRKGSITSNPKDVNVSSIFTIFYIIWDYWKNNIFTETENIAISYFMENLYSKINEYKGQLKHNISPEIGNYAEKYLFDRTVNFYHINIDFEEFNQIRNAKRVWLYGAGNVGKETAIFLENNNIHIEGFVVTKRSDRDYLYGWKIYELDELNLNGDDIVVLSVVPGSICQLQKNLERIGFAKYIYATKKEDYLDAGFRLLRN